MSNHLAIAAATSTLAMLMRAAAEVVDGADATIQRPKEITDTALINIYLYQIGFNPNFQNTDLPTRRDDGTVIQRPQAALDLYYLLSFYGKNELDAQILLGSAASVLHARPILSREMIRKEIERRITDDPDDPLAGADLADQIEKIRFTPLSLNLEEMSKLWSVMLQVKYTLSVAYKASVVLIETEVSPQRALPVRIRGVHVAPFNCPVIEKVESAKGEADPIRCTSTIVISGRNLKSEITMVRIGEVEVALDQSDNTNTFSDTSIRLALNSPLFTNKPLRAGMQPLQVAHPVTMNYSDENHVYKEVISGFQSNVKIFPLHPDITHDSTVSNELKITFIPRVGWQQRVRAFLNRIRPGEQDVAAYTIDAPANNGIADKKQENADTDKITFPLQGIAQGDYLLRVEVDRVESLLDLPLDADYSQNPARITIQ